MPMPSIVLSNRRLGGQSLDFKPKYDLYKILYPDDTKAVNDMVLSLAEMVDKIRVETACYTCPRKGWCHRIKWNKCLDLVKCVGCDMHPDQVKFKGHSTTLNFIYDNYAVTNEGIANFGTCIGAASGNAARGYGNATILSSLSGTYSNGRQINIVDSQAIPDPANITSAAYYFYLESTNYANTDATSARIRYDSTFTYPLGGGDLADYSSAKFDTTGSAALNFASMTQNAWNSMAFTSTSQVSKTGNTKWYVLTGLDISASSPSGLNQLRIQSYVGNNRPYLAVTYDDVAAVKHYTPYSKMTVVN